MKIPPIYFSFFMFDSNTRLYDAKSRQLYIQHMKELVGYGYTGFELHAGRSPEYDTAYPSYGDEIEAYRSFREEVDEAGLHDIELATNVGATTGFDPSSDSKEVRQAGLDFLKSRVDITAALRGKIMMGPLVIPYGAFVHSAPNGAAVWSDALQADLVRRYHNAAPILQQLGEYAASRAVKLAIEPITHWETPGPNKLSQLLDFLELVPSTQVGAIIDSAHETLDGDGPDVFPGQVVELAKAGRLHYAQASPPDRGGLESSWLPWRGIFEPILANYDGPIAIEIFNAVPDFAAGLRLSRRKYWIPGVDAPNSSAPSAYEVAKTSLRKLQDEFGKILNACSNEPDEGDVPMDQPIAGSWKLVTWRRIDEAGAVSYPFGESPRGVLIYSPDGKMAVQMFVADRPKIDTRDPLGGDVEKRATAYSTCLAYFGSYEVQGQSVIHRVEASLFPNWSDTVQERPLDLEGDRLVLRTPKNDGIVNEIIWEREHQNG